MVNPQDEEYKVGLKIDEERIFQLCYDNMINGFAYHKIMFDDNGKPVDYIFLKVNDTFERLTGLKREHILGKKVTAVLPGIEKDPADWINRYGNVAITGKPVRFENYSEPLKKWFLVSAYTNEIGYFATTFEDITSQKLAEKELQLERDNLIKVFNSMEDGVCIIHQNYDLTFTNLALEKFFGSGKEKKCYAYFHDRNEVCPWCRNEEVFVGKTIRWEWYSPKNQRTYDLMDTPIKNPDGTISKLEMFRDITERKEMEDELRVTLEVSHSRQSEVSALLSASKAVLQNREFKDSARAIFDSCKGLLDATAGYIALLTKDGKENEVLFLDAGGLHCTVNSSLPMPIRGLRGEAYAKGKVVYCNDFAKSEYTDLMPKGHVELKNVLFAPLVVEGKTLGLIGLANKPEEFTERDAEMAAAFGEIVSIALVNSQTLEKLESIIEERTKKLRDSERLAAIGATAGMVGHDIRNPLQAMTSDVYLALSDLDSMPEGTAKNSLRESLDSIQKNIDYVSKIVQDLQDFAKPLSPNTREIELDKILDEVLVTRAIPEWIEVNRRVDNGALNLISDPDLLKRIFANLINNSVQAMPNGGKLTIRAYKEDNSFVITVQDTGVGIPEKIKPNLFTPLFTTKSKGQGFGLAVIKRMTEVLGGTVTFESQEGKGTKFTIKLPDTRWVGA